MKKRIIILSALTIFLIILTTALIQYGYFEYILDNRKIDRENKDFTAVVTLSIGPNALIINPHYTIIQIRSDKTITENTFREIRWEYNPLHISRTYDDKIIKGKTRTLSDKEYDSLIDVLKTSDFGEIQREIDSAALYLDGNSTYITIRDENGFSEVGGHCAENKDHRFKSMMDYICGLLE